MSEFVWDIAAIQQEFPQLSQKRMEDSHKGTFGTAVIVGGSQGMTGAALLAGMAALKLGCGKVFIGFSQKQLPIAVFEHMPEIMIKTAQEALQLTHVSAWCIGCGLGKNQQTELLFNKILNYSRKLPVVIDADALNILAEQEIKLPFSEYRILTPHPTEAARLLKQTTEAIQKNRQEAAKALAKQYGSWIVLKGHHTIIASPQGEIWLNTSGNSGLATAGSGDVLSGILTGLLAQGISVKEAVRAAVYLHGLAAQYLASQGVGPIGLTATEIIDIVRLLRNRLAYP